MTSRSLWLSNLLPAVRSADAATVVLADGFSCRTQLQQLSSRRGIHLAQLLAERLDQQGPST
jgi:Fe-S oxidoreductase